MAAGNTAGGDTVALGRSKEGILASGNGSKPKRFAVNGTLTAASLAVALQGLPQAKTVLIIGTRADGTPGWDAVDAKELAAATPLEVVFLSEAQALALEPDGKNPAAWIILATTGTGKFVQGSARWWVQHAKTGVIGRTDVRYMGDNYGQIYTLCGGSLADMPTMVAGMVEALIAAHPRVRRVHVWSQDGLVGHKAYMQGTDGNGDGTWATFWSALRLPKKYTASGGDVVIVPDAMAPLQTASTYGMATAKQEPAGADTEPTPEE